MNNKYELFLTVSKQLKFKYLFEASWDENRFSTQHQIQNKLQKTGKTVIKYLKKRKITGDDLRREMWVHDVAETPKAARKTKGIGYDVT